MELLIRVHTRPGTENNPLALRRGDVIEQMPDSWPWTAREKANPEWRILKSSSLLPSVAEAMVAGTENVDENLITGSTVFPSRRLSLNLDYSGLSQSLKDYLEDSTRELSGYVINDTDLQTLMDTVIVREPEYGD